MQQALRLFTQVMAAPQAIFDAITTESESQQWFAPKCRIEPVVGGAFEHYFMEDAPAGHRGSEGCVFTALEAPYRLAFTWNFPPTLPTIRDERTQVEITITPLEGGFGSEVVLTQTGWGEGGEWPAGYAYFERAWKMVLDNLSGHFQ